MAGRGRLATVVGFAVAATILAGLFWVVGTEDVLAALSRASLPVVAVVGVALVGWLLAWSAALHFVLDATGVRLPVATTVLVYASAVFANNVTPFGQAGGEPVSAYVIADAADVEYETGLATIASVDAVNLFPSLSFALVGLVYYATIANVGARLSVVAGSVVAMAVAVPVGGALAWRYHERLAAGATALLAAGWRVASLLPGVASPDRESVASRVDGFVDDLARIATTPRRLAAALTCSALGWLLQAAALWLAFLALGSPIPAYVPLFVVPIGAIAGAVPTPGGLGGIEAVNVALLALVAPVGVATATAAVAIHRVGGFLFMTSLGGGSLAFLRARGS